MSRALLKWLWRTARDQHNRVSLDVAVKIFYQMMK